MEGKYREMRVKLLRDKGESTVLLLYPSTIEEYVQALDTVGGRARVAGSGDTDAGGAVRRPGYGSYVVTTADQRERWALPDRAASGGARVVDEARALGLLRDGAAWPETTDEPRPDSAAPGSQHAGADDSALEAVRALVSPGGHLEQVVGALEGAGLPRPVYETLRRKVRALASEAAEVDEALDWAEMIRALPWRRRERERFDSAHLKQALDGTHGALDKVKTRLVQVLAACPQTRGPLTLERPRRNRGAETDLPPALVVRPGPPGAPVPCLAGPSGTGKTTLAVSVAEALGRAHVRCRWARGTSST